MLHLLELVNDEHTAAALSAAKSCRQFYWTLCGGCWAMSQSLSKHWRNGVASRKDMRTHQVRDSILNTNCRFLLQLQTVLCQWTDLLPFSKFHSLILHWSHQHVTCLLFFLLSWVMCPAAIETDCTFNDGTLPQTVGAQFAQLVKELRTEYSNATVYCCEVMAKSIMSNPSNMIPNILHHAHGGLSGVLIWGPYHAMQLTRVSFIEMSSLCLLHLGWW